MRFPTITVIVSAVSLAASVSAATRERKPPATSLTFCHWWTSPSESAALGAVVQLYEKKHGAKVSALPMARGVRGEYAEVRGRIDRKLPLESFQANGGYGERVFFDAGFLSPIDELWASDRLERVIPPLIRELNRIDGRYYSVPVNLHRTNLVWYNKPLLDKHKIKASALGTWAAFFKAAETLKGAKVASPVQMGTTWTAGLAFESIMASLGIETYEDWINGKITAPDDPRLVKVLTTFQTYVGYANPDHADIEWDVAIGRVMKGDSAFCIMGDWADGEFRGAGMKYGQDYDAILVPETRGMYGLTVDTFVRARGADPTAANRWLSLVASREGQDAFNPPKGSVPARTDADLSLYGPYQRSAIADFKAAEHMYPNSVPPYRRASTTRSTTSSSRSWRTRT